MKKSTFIINSLITIFITAFASVSVIAAAESVDINDALKKGLISLSMTGLDRGELVELKITRLSAAPLVIAIHKGRTNIASQVSVLADRDREIDLSSNDRDSIILPQTGVERYSQGEKQILPEDPLCYLYCVK